MQSLARLVTKPNIGGEPLPPVFKSLAKYDVVLRRGEMTIIAGQPGGGKTALALAFARKLGLPVLYLCPDSSATTILVRLVSAETGKSRAEVETAMEVDPDWAQHVLRRFDHIRWSFSGTLTLEDIDMELSAFIECYGQAPAMIVVDNLIDISDGDGDEFAALRATTRSLKQLARAVDACVLVLHHTSEAVEARPCPPRKSIHGKVAQLPALILTVAVQPGSILVAPVKNRHGYADASGQTAYWLKFNASTMQVEDPE